MVVRGCTAFRFRTVSDDGNIKKKDEFSGSNETFTLIFDSFNDKENGLGFATIPTALRHGFTIYKDAMGDFHDALNDSWNTFWDVKTTKNDLGWYVEMRIPFSIMRFKEDDGKMISILYSTKDATPTVILKVRGCQCLVTGLYC